MRGGNGRCEPPSRRSWGPACLSPFEVDMESALDEGRGAFLHPIQRLRIEDS